MAVKFPGRPQLIAAIRGLLDSVCYQEEAVEIWCRGCVKALGGGARHAHNCPVEKAERVLAEMGAGN